MLLALSSADDSAAGSLITTWTAFRTVSRNPYTNLIWTASTTQSITS